MAVTPRSPISRTWRRATSILCAGSEGGQKSGRIAPARRHTGIFSGTVSLQLRRRPVPLSGGKGAAPQHATEARSQRPARIPRSGGGLRPVRGPGTVHAPIFQPVCAADRGAGSDRGVSAEDGNGSGTADL